MKMAKRMIRNNKRICLVLTLLLFVTGCSDVQSSNQGETKQEASANNVEITISAAASLQNALNEIKGNFEKENKHVKVFYNFGASGALQQQIFQGAPVDLFFSAAEDKFDELVSEGLIEEKNGVDLVGNELVLVVPNDSNKEIKSFKDLIKSKRISIGTPESVPAGKYAKDALETLDIWDSVQGKIVYAKDVRQVLTYVETNNVNAGIVYKTDALLSKKVSIVSSAEENTHDPIIYPLGIMKKSDHQKEAHLFYDYLQSDESLQVLEKYGFKRLQH